MIVNSERDANVSFNDSTVTNIQTLNAQEAHNHNHNHSQINNHYHFNTQIIHTTKANSKKPNKKRKSHTISTESNEPPNKKRKTTSNKILKSKLNTKVKEITKNGNNERKYITKQFKESLVQILQPGTKIKINHEKYKIVKYINNDEFEVYDYGKKTNKNIKFKNINFKIKSISHSSHVNNKNNNNTKKNDDYHAKVYAMRKKLQKYLEKTNKDMNIKNGIGVIWPKSKDKPMYYVKRIGKGTLHLYPSNAVHRYEKSGGKK